MIFKRYEWRLLLRIVFLFITLMATAMILVRDSTLYMYLAITFPLWVYGAVKVGIPPQVFAMGTMIFLFGAVLAIGNVIFQRRSEKAAAPAEVTEPQTITTVL